MHSRTRSADGYVVTHVSGDVRPEDFLVALHQLRDFTEDGRVYELVVHSDDVRVHGDFRDLREFVASGRDVLSRLDAGAVAFVAASKVDYGICRQLRALLVLANVPIEVFIDEAEARAWLASRVRLARSPAA